MADDRVDVSNFKIDLLRRTAPEPLPICAECKDQGMTPEEALFLQYEIDDTSCTRHGIWCRVLCINRMPFKENEKNRFSESLLGPSGHLERMNVWSHLAAGAIYVVYLLVRQSYTPMGADDSVTSTLAAVSYGSFAFTFFSSVVYHVYSPNRRLSAVTRLLDYFGIYVGIACGTLSDLSATTIHLQNVPVQSVADVFAGALLLTVFFVTRRCVLPIDETRLPILQQKCTLGFGRKSNVDLEHGSLRAAAGTALAFGWILMIPGAFETLELDCAWVFSGSRFVGTGVLIAGMAWDNLVAFPDNWFDHDNASGSGCLCYNKRDGCGGGWVVTSHTIWHWVALLSTVVTTIGTEYVVAVSDVLD